jgi:methyl-accepting chemotaxis protein
LVAQAIAFDIATTMTLYQDAALSASEDRRKTVDAAIAEFRATINETVSAVKTVSDALSNGSAGMKLAAEETSQRMKSTAKASDATNAVVQATAAATEELSQSISKIGSQSEGNLSLATGAARNAEISMNNLSALSVAVDQIETVADMISQIAGQTNLLALNATIEAARAGESGKGFAVVAAEVKALANQTEKATDAISRHIAAIQLAARDLNGQLGSVAHAVKEISSVAATIGQAVHEQTAATNEIAVSIQSAAKYTVQASEDVQVVETSITNSLGIVRDFVDLTERLSLRTADLERKVTQFFSSVRAA